MTLISPRRADERGSTEPRGREIRRLSAYVEGVGSLRFVVLLGLAGGMVEGIPRLFMPVRDSANLGLTLLRTPLWFLGAAIAITMGRQLSAGAPAVVAVPLTASDGEAEQSSEF